MRQAWICALFRSRVVAVSRKNSVQLRPWSTCWVAAAYVAMIFSGPISYASWKYYRLSLSMCGAGW